MAVLPATGWPDLATNCNFVIIPHNQFISGRAKLFSAKAGPMAVLPTRSRSNGWPDLQISTTNCIFAIIRTIGRAKPIKSRPNGLSTRGSMAALSRQKQPDSRFQRPIAFLLLSRAISLSAAGPSYSQQKQAQWPFYQREAQWPFYQGRSNRMARPPDLNDKLHFRYYPARSVYQRPTQGPMAVLSRAATG